MSDLFLLVLKMSLAGSVVLLITMLARFLLRKRSKKFIMILWAVVALRFMLPFSIGSAFSIFNLVHVRIPDHYVTAVDYESIPLNGYDAVVTNTVDQETEVLPDEPYEQTAYESDVSDSACGVSVHDTYVSHGPDVITVASYIWIAGVLALAGYCIFRFIMLKLLVKDARRIEDGVYESSKIKTPFVFGLLTPKIYVPVIMNDTERAYILSHERTHIKHGDWKLKLWGMAAVTIHWFNPLIWIGYHLFEQDIEMSCDETTVKYMDAETKRAYAMSIVSYANGSNNKAYLVSPLCFSRRHLFRSAAGNRITNIINYKSSTKFTAAAIIITLLATSAVCGFDSKSASVTAEENVEEVLVEELAANEEQIVSEAEQIDPERVIPKIITLSDNEKLVTFYRNGTAISGKLRLPAGEGPFRTIIINGNLHSTYYNDIAERFNICGYATLQVETLNCIPSDCNKDLYFDDLWDISTVVDDMKYIYGIDLENLYLFGYSLGAYRTLINSIHCSGKIKGLILVEPVMNSNVNISYADKTGELQSYTVNLSTLLSVCDINTVIISGENSTVSKDEIYQELRYLQNGQIFVIAGANNMLSGQYCKQMVEETVRIIGSWN